MKIYTDIIQGTEEWEEVRKLHYTASNASTILARGKGVETLIKEMLTDYYSSGNFPEYSDKYQNNNMQRGKDYEDKARAYYELVTNNTVEQVGFIETDDFEGCSPDGLINNDGLVEIKNPNDKRFIDLILTGKVDKKYIDQMQMQMYVTGRDWCDFFAFNPNFETPYYLKRFYPEPDVQIALKAALSEAKEKLKTIKNVLDEKMKGLQNEN